MKYLSNSFVNTTEDNFQTKFYDNANKTIRQTLKCLILFLIYSSKIHNNLKNTSLTCSYTIAISIMLQCVCIYNNYTLIDSFLNICINSYGIIK